MAGSAEFIGWYEAAHADAPVSRGHEGCTPVDFQRSHERLGGVLEDLLEAARVPAVAAALDRHAHAIAMHDSGHLRRREEHGFFLAFDSHESKAGAIGAHDAFGDSCMALRLPGRSGMGAARPLFLRMTRLFMASARFVISTFQIVLPGS